MPNTPPKTPPRPQVSVASANQRAPLRIAEIAAGYYYSVQFVYPQFLNYPFPLQHVPAALSGQTPKYEVEQMQTRKQNGMLTATNIGRGRICLVVSIKDDHVVLLLSSTQPRTTFAGTEHRWIPFEGSPHLALQPRVAVKTAPTAAALTNPLLTASKPYLCFTHALKVQPVTAYMPLPNTPTPGNGTFKFTKGFVNGGDMLYCPNIDELRAVHVAYWQGVRYDNRGQQVKAGGPSGTSGSGSDPGGDNEPDHGGMSDGGGAGWSGFGSGNSSSLNRHESSSNRSGTLDPPGDISEELSEGAGAVTGHSTIASSGGDKRKASPESIHVQRVHDDGQHCVEGIKLAQFIEDVEFLPPVNLTVRGDWVKDEDVFISPQDRQRMLQAITGNPDAQLGTFEDGYWEPIEESESENEDEGAQDQAAHDAAINKADGMIRSDGIALPGSFRDVMLDEAMPTHAMFFSFAGDGTVQVA